LIYELHLDPLSFLSWTPELLVWLEAGLERRKKEETKAMKKAKRRGRARRH